MGLATGEGGNGLSWAGSGEGGKGLSAGEAGDARGPGEARGPRGVTEGGRGGEEMLSVGGEAGEGGDRIGGAFFSSSSLSSDRTRSLTRLNPPNVL